MNQNLNRAQLLYQQSRYDLAEQEIRQALGEVPDDAEAHALLAMCLVQQKKFDEAQAEAEQATVMAPDMSYAHYCSSHVFSARRWFAEAEAAAREAIRLDPLDPRGYSRLSMTLIEQSKWQAALDSALEGLSHDPDHKGCNSLRVVALTNLGRQDESVAAVDTDLARDPDDDVAHTNKGWALMHQGKPREALEHFREALRIDPTFEYAQRGIVEALKARNPLYRWVLAYFLWMARLSSRARWGVVLGGYFGYRFLLGFARENPEWAPWVTPLLVLYVVFALLTWFAVPLFNLLLRFNKFGWYALTRDKRTASNWFGGCLIALVGALIAYFAWGYDLALLVAIAAVGMALPLVTIYNCDAGWPRQAMTWFTAAMAAVGGAMIACGALNHAATSQFANLFLIGFIATPWVANYLVTVTPKR